MTSHVGVGSATLTALVSIDLLVASDSPRLAGEDVEHVRVLAESGAVLPPIIVQRGTMRVVDGMHRLRAAQLRGEHEIAVRFFDGTDADAFVLAVGENIVHGLSLTPADRRAAAARIIESHRHWSDRSIAAATGLSPKTVGAVRATGTAPRADVRVGLDGRARPMDSTRGRLVASELITERPDASLRDIAKVAGISTGTVRDVRDRLRRGEHPGGPGRTRSSGRPFVDHVAILRSLRDDPSLRFTAAGRIVLRLLDTLAIGGPESERLIDNLPEHCVTRLAGAARACADAWCLFADRLERRSQKGAPSRPAS